MDLYQLRAAVAVDRCGRFTEAAWTSYTNLSALGRQVRAL
jgi:DNA-binding transcriptional LysR family regulator